MLLVKWLFNKKTWKCFKWVSSCLITLLEQRIQLLWQFWCAEEGVEAAAMSSRFFKGSFARHPKKRLRRTNILTGWTCQNFVSVGTWLSLCTSQVAHQAGVYPGFPSMKRLGVVLLPPEWDASPSQVYPQNFASTHLYTWVERSTARVRYLGQEHNTKSPAKARSQTACSEDEHAHQEATAPPIRWLILKEKAPLVSLDFRLSIRELIYSPFFSYQ